MGVSCLVSLVIKMFLFLSILFCLSISNALGDCPSGWVDAAEYDLGCLLLYNKENGNNHQHTWGASNDFCNGLGNGTRLVEIYTRPKSCLRPSTCPPCMLPSKLCSPSMPLAVPLVLSWTLVMVSPTPSPSMKVMPSPTPSSVWTWLAASSPTTSWRSSPREATPSPPPLSVRLSVTSRRSSAMLLLTSSRRWPPLLHQAPLRRATSFPTDRSSPSETRDSDAQRPSSSHPSWEWSLAVSMRPPTTPS